MADRLSKNLTVNDIAKKHKVNPSIIDSEIQKGHKDQQKQHGMNYGQRIKTAMDHEVEDPKYYTKIGKVIKQAKVSKKQLKQSIKKIIRQMIQKIPTFQQFKKNNPKRTQQDYQHHVLNIEDMNFYSKIADQLQKNPRQSKNQMKNLSYRFNQQVAAVAGTNSPAIRKQNARGDFPQFATSVSDSKGNGINMKAQQKSFEERTELENKENVKFDLDDAWEDLMKGSADQQFKLPREQSQLPGLSKQQIDRMSPQQRREYEFNKYIDQKENFTADNFEDLDNQQFDEMSEARTNGYQQHYQSNKWPVTGQQRTAHGNRQGRETNWIVPESTKVEDGRLNLQQMVDLMEDFMVEAQKQQQIGQTRIVKGREYQGYDVR